MFCVGMVVRRDSWDLISVGLHICVQVRVLSLSEFLTGDLKKGRLKIE